MTGPRHKGIWPAVTPIERVASARLRLYLLYDRDDDLKRALTDFHASWWTPFGAALRRLPDCLPDVVDGADQLADRIEARVGARYLADLVGIASAAGLNRIPSLGTPPVLAVGYLPSGLAQAHRFVWYLDKAILGERAPTLGLSSVPARPTFARLASFGTPIPSVHPSIAGSEAEWDPRTELLASVRRRLRQETDLDPEVVEAELARIAAEGGYEFPDSVTMRSGIWRLERDAQWVWWRLRYQWTYPQIAQEWESLHPGDIQLQAQADDVAPGAGVGRREPWPMTVPADAVGQVRKAVTVFARRAQVDAQTGPGRRRKLPR